MQSVVSYPNLVKYGKSNYRGNCSGYIIKDICEHFVKRYTPAIFIGTFHPKVNSVRILERTKDKFISTLEL